MSNYENDLFIKNLKSFISTLIIKNSFIADKLDKFDNLSSIHNFMNANKFQDPNILFDVFDYTPAEQKAVGITEEYQFNDQIPYKYRNALVSNKMVDIKAGYIEYNDYYRMLNGEPEISKIDNNTDIKNIKINKVIDQQYAINVDLYGNGEFKYLWQLTDTELSYYVENLVDTEIKYRETNTLSPETYLKYLKHPIDYFTARNADNLFVLYYDKNILSEELTKRFIELYYENLAYVNAVFYNEFYETQFYYNSFLTIIVIFLTVQRLISERLLFGLKRDFFDLESIKDMFESYNLPFFNEIPISFQRKILKNINTFLQYKGTNKVMIDIVKLFGFEDANVFRYFLIKSARNGLQFVRIPIDETTLTKYLKDESYYEDYWSVVKDDSFWGQEENDQEFFEELSDLDFNYISAKYISVDTLKDIYKSNIDISYFFNAVRYYNSKGYMKELKFKNTYLKPSGALIDLYDLFIGIYILTCWYYGYSDLLLYDGSSYGYVYGFNFDVVESDLKESIEYIESVNEYKLLAALKEYSKTLNPATTEYIEVKAKIESLTQLTDYSEVSRLLTKLTSSIDSADDLMDNFLNNQEYKNLLEGLIQTAPTLKIKKSLQKIYDATMYTKYISLTMGTGYETFSDYLKQKDIEFYSTFLSKYENKSPDNISEGLTSLFEEIQKYIDNASFESIVDGTITSQNVNYKEYLLSILSIFKAYTVDLKKINTFLIFNNKQDDRLYAFFELQNLKKKTTIGEYASSIDDAFGIVQKFYKTDQIDIEDVELLKKAFISEEKINIYETIVNVLNKRHLIADNFTISDLYGIKSTLDIKDSIVLNDSIGVIIYWIFRIDIFDDNFILNYQLTKSEKMNNSDFLKILKKVPIDSTLNISDKIILKRSLL